MKFKLSTLLVALGILGLGSAWYVHSMRPGSYYRGYFSQQQRILALMRRADPAVNVTGTGGGGGGGTDFPLMLKFTHEITAGQPITEDLLNGIRRILLEELRAQGIKVLATKDLNGADAHYPAAGVRLMTWGFQVAFEENRYKGVVSVRLTSKAIPGTASMGHLGELFENIVVFPRD